MNASHLQSILDVLEKAKLRLELAGPNLTSAPEIAFAIQQAHEGIGRAVLMLRLVSKPELTGAKISKSEQG